MMRRSRFLVPFISAILILVARSISFAWNYTGHRVIASIAYRQLDEQTKRKIAEILKKHPAYGDLWANRATNGPDEALDPLWSASVFPDDARSEPWRRHGRSLSYAAVEKLADDMALEYPRAGFTDELTKTNIRDLADRCFKVRSVIRRSVTQA